MRKILKTKKAVSPVIATILLVSIVVVLAAIIFIWFRSFTKEAIMKNGKNIELVCEDAKFTASYDSASEILSISNDGNVPIAELQIKTGGETRKTINIDSTNTAWGLGLGSGQAKEIELPGTGTPVSMIVIPVLKGRTSKGESNLACDERYGLNIQII